MTMWRATAATALWRSRAAPPSFPVGSRGLLHAYMASEPRFELDGSFLSSYADRDPNFGLNGLGEFVYYRTYARRKDDGTLESWCASFAL